MKIRKQQMIFLDEQQSATYELRLTRFLQEQFPDAAAEPASNLRPEVANQIERARGYGFANERDIADYVVTAWVLGTDYDTEFPAANEVLTAQIPGEMKAHFLEAWTNEMFEKLEEPG